MYTAEKNAQILIALLKKSGIRKIIASPGTTNMCFVASVQNDPFFDILSVVDERSAAYIACGLSAESNEPVVLSCTGATASRNYLPGLTEAYYRKIPILAITSAQDESKIGHNFPQVIDRRIMPNDTVKHSINLPLIKDNTDLWSCEVKINNAILELTRDGGGPVHINLNTSYNELYTTKELPSVRKIDRLYSYSKFPDLPQGKVAIFIGSHMNMSPDLVKAIDSFCASNDAVVFSDHTSGYNGEYAINPSLYSSQRYSCSEELKPNLLIHIGEVTGNYYNNNIIGKEIWRLSEDGELKDTFKKLTFIFQMSELFFFEKYTKNKTTKSTNYLKQCKSILSDLTKQIPSIPFSNIWVAKEIHHKIPKGSIIHFGILNSLRSWNFFQLDKSINSSCNVGGFGIDGCISTLVGASFANKEKLCFGVFGDLAFFYDLNCIGNRHIGNNLRILLINNGKGTEFRHFSHIASHFGDSADKFIAAEGHFGKKSKTLVKNYSENLGFEYISASSKSEFKQNSDLFLNPEIKEKPILFEVFTNSNEESDALKMLTSIKSDIKGKSKRMILDKIGLHKARKLKKLLLR